MRIANSGVIADKDSFDHILVAAQMWGKSFLPFEHEDDLDPELVRIALDCGHCVVNMTSLDRFVEEYPDYEFDDWEISVIARHSIPSEEFIEHIMRTLPDNASLLIHPNVIEKIGFEFVDRIVKGNPNNQHLSEHELNLRVMLEKKGFIRSLFDRGCFGDIERIIFNPETPDEVIHCINGMMLKFPEKTIKHIQSLDSSIEFLKFIANGDVGDSIKNAAQNELTVNWDFRNAMSTIDHLRRSEGNEES